MQNSEVCMFMIEHINSSMKTLCIRHQASVLYKSNFHVDTLNNAGLCKLNVNYFDYIHNDDIKIYENFFIKMNLNRNDSYKSKIYKKRNALASEYFLHLDGYNERALIVLDWYKHSNDRFFSHIQVYNKSYMKDMVPCSEKIKILGRAPEWIKRGHK